jgi:hypothetical protein
MRVRQFLPSSAANRPVRRLLRYGRAMTLRDEIQQAFDDAHKRVTQAGHDGTLGDPQAAVYHENNRAMMEALFAIADRVERLEAGQTRLQ